MIGKLGKKPARIDHRTLKLAKYLVPSNLPVLPPASDYTRGIPLWPMLLNDQLGDCVCAAILHAIQLMTANSGTMLIPTDADALALYEAIGNYNPADPSTDQGCVMLDAMNYWKSHGIMVGGTLHKIDAFATINLNDLDQMRMAIHLFGCALIGVNLPSSAETQFDAGQPWSVVAGARDLGGHCILPCKYDPQYLYEVTWGKNQPTTPDWFKYMDEAYVALSIEDWAGNTPSAVDTAALNIDLAGLA